MRAPRLLRRTTLAATALLVLAGALSAPVASPGVAAGVTAAEGCVESVPDPGTTTPVRICYTLVRPAGATAERPVPLIMHSHGWGASRVLDPAEFADFTDAGYGVLSFDQRGWGGSGGHAYVASPRYEGADVRQLVGLVSRLPWVQQDGPGDPRLGAIGGSYGGGFQFLGAFELLRLRGTPVFDALAPQITWNSLPESLAPRGVVRTGWAAFLSALAVPSDAAAPQFRRGLLEAAATGRWPDGSVPGSTDLDSFLRRNGPAHHVAQGRRLDIPVLFGQGTTDGLLPLEQGLRNWRTALTPQARRSSIFVGYNGGHVMPAVIPSGIAVTSDPCSTRLAGGDFEQLSIRFFDEQLRGLDRGLRGYQQVHLATPTSTCTTTDARALPTRSVKVGTVASSTSAGLPLSYEVARGPLRLAGSAHLTGVVTALGVDNRAYVGLAVGRSARDARLVQNNVMPVSEPTPVLRVRRQMELPAVAVDVPAGQRLYLLVSPVSDTFGGTTSRTPGLITVDRTVVHLPVWSAERRARDTR